MDDEILKSLTNHSYADVMLDDEQELIGEGASGTVYKLTSSQYTVTPICKKEYKINAGTGITQTPTENAINEFKNGMLINHLSPKYCLFIDTYKKILTQTGAGLFTRLFRRTRPAAADGNFSIDIVERVDKPPALFLQYFPSNIKVDNFNWYDPETERPIPDENMYEIMYQVVYVLSKELGFQHNDIKCANIMIYKLQDPITFQFDGFGFNTRYIAKLIDYGNVNDPEYVSKPNIDLISCYKILNLTEKYENSTTNLERSRVENIAELMDLLQKEILDPRFRPTRVVFECDGIHLVKVSPPRLRNGGKRRNTKAKKRTTRRRWTKRV